MSLTRAVFALRTNFGTASTSRQLAARGLQTVASTTPESLTSAINLVRSEPSHYVIATLAGRKYILTPRDLLTVPRLNDVKVGDTLALTDIHELGSREYTIRGEPLIPEGTIDVKATVIEHTKGKMEEIVKKKRRKGYKKTIKHKQTYTRLRISDISFPETSSPAL